MDLKTPVSALQEHLVSLKKVPTYELIHNGTGTHNPLFIYRVHANNTWADGNGKSKQEAKHRAAENMLKKLNINDSENVGIQKDLEDIEIEMGQNYVGMLKEYCILQPYPDPTYDVVEEAGQPHCKIFKMRCCVSQLEEFGISSTKKYAKQIAAHRMLERIKKLSINQDNLCNKGNEKNKKQEVLKEYQIKKCTLIPKSPLSKEEVMKRINAIKGTCAIPTRKERAVLYKDQHKAYIGLDESSAVLASILEGKTVVKLDNGLDLIKNIATELGAELSETEIPGKNDKNFISLSMSGNSDWPPLSSIDTDVNQAAFNILNSLVILSSGF